ncbi:hypothetical protein DND67_08490 [Pseudomonas syringae pv. pisi]|nr:hypothetical protein DND67_08490 [Pseudomonas syringae pv. pisi]
MNHDRARPGPALWMRKIAKNRSGDPGQANEGRRLIQPTNTWQPASGSYAVNLVLQILETR